MIQTNRSGELFKSVIHQFLYIGLVAIHYVNDVLCNTIGPLEIQKIHDRLNVSRGSSSSSSIVLGHPELGIKFEKSGDTYTAAYTFPSILPEDVRVPMFRIQRKGSETLPEFQQEQVTFLDGLLTVTVDTTEEDVELQLLVYLEEVDEQAGKLVSGRPVYNFQFDVSDKSWSAAWTDGGATVNFSLTSALDDGLRYVCATGTGMFRLIV